MQDAGGLLVSLDDGIKRITFNRPERRNSVDFDTTERLHDEIVRSAGDGTRVVVLTGAGESFCSGADLQGIGGGDLAKFDITDSIRRRVNPAILAMRSLPKPIIARVHGAAVGVGCNYALACDIVIASEQARFGQVFVKIGLMPDGGSTYFLPRLVGYHRAFELMATGDVIPAQDAMTFGMVNRVVPFADLDGVVDDLARRLAHGPEVALAKIKEGLRYGETSDLAGALDFEAVNQTACFTSEDFAEGVRAFLEKRKPQFRST